MTGRQRPYPSRRLTRALGAATSGRACLEAVGADDLARALPPGTTREALLAEAARQADLLAHPYLDRDHLRLAALRLTGQRAAWQSLVAALPTGIPATGWRPRGLRSAARRRGLAETARRQAHATTRESARPWPN